MYNEVLAIRVLEVLDRSFPNQIAFADVKSQLGSETKDDELLLVFDALEKDGLIAGVFIRTGAFETLRAVYSAQLTFHGHQRAENEGLKDLSRLVQLGDLRFEQISRTIYEHPITEAHALLRRCAAHGGALSGGFIREVTSLVLQSLQQLERAFIESYIETFRDSCTGVTSSLERWLLWKLDAIWEKELARSREVTTSLLRSLPFGEPQLKAALGLLDKAQDFKQHAVAEIKIAALKRDVLRVTATQAPRAEQPEPANVDVAVITIREDEYDAVLRRLPGWEVTRRKHRSYVIAKVASQDGTPYRVALLRTVEQGPNAGQDAARDIIEDLDPQWLALVGIGGAIPHTELTLGDVVVATRLHDFTVGALIEESRSQFVNQGGPMKKEVQDLIALLPALKRDLAGWETDSATGLPCPQIDMGPDNFYGPASWKEKVTEALNARFGSTALRHHPIVTARPVASSGSLIKDTGTVQQWLQTARDLVAVEMELSGVYAAARRMDREYPILAIRGISDIVGFKRDPGWTAYACNTAASLFIALLRALPSCILISGREGDQTNSLSRNPSGTRTAPPADRPRIVFHEWGEIPDDHPLPIRSGQAGFHLVNDGAAAYEVTVEPFEVGPSARARGESLARIDRGGEAFTLVWLEGYSGLAIASQKWDLLGALAIADTESGGGGGMHGGPDYTISVSVTYRDADCQWWFRSSAQLTYIRSQNRISFGATSHDKWGPSRETMSEVFSERSSQSIREPQETKPVAKNVSCDHALVHPVFGEDGEPTDEQECAICHARFRGDAGPTWNEL